MGWDRGSRQTRPQVWVSGFVSWLMVAVLTPVAAVVAASVSASPAQAMTPGLSTLAGSDTVGISDGVGASATFDRLIDLKMAPDGVTLYALDQSSNLAVRHSAVRKIDTSTGQVTTISQDEQLDGPSHNTPPTHLALDASGNVYVSTDGGIMKIIDGSPSMLIPGANLGAFAVSPDQSTIFYVSEDVPEYGFRFNKLRSIGIEGGPASSGAVLGKPGAWNWFPGEIYDMAFGVDGKLYLNWDDTASNLDYHAALWRFEGANAFTQIDGNFYNQQRMVFAPNSSTLYARCDADYIIGPNSSRNRCQGSNLVVRRLNFGAGAPTTIVGNGPGFEEGYPGKMNMPMGEAISPDGQTMFIADQLNHRIRRTALPPDPALLSADELDGGSNAGEQCNCHVPKTADPVVLATGNFTESVSDLVIPSRGPGLSVTRTYNSSRAGQAGLFGQGWWSDLDTGLVIDPVSGAVSVIQENGAQLHFELAGDASDYIAPPRVTSTLSYDDNTDTYTLVRHARDTLVFDDSGRLISRRDTNGNGLGLAYTGSQITLTETGTNSAGRTLSFALSNGHVATVTDPVGRTVSYTYSGDDLVGVTSLKANPTDASGVSFTYSYDPTSHRLVSFTDGKGATVTNHYDVAGRVDYQIDRAGKRTDLTYSGTDPLTVTVSEPANNAAGSPKVTQHVFTHLLLTEKTVAHGTDYAATWYYSYDPALMVLTTITGPGGVVQSTIGYDTSGNATSVQDALGRTTTFTYDALNNVTEKTDPMGVATTNTYDTAGNLIETCTPLGPLPAPGHKIKCGDPNTEASRTTFAYDPAHPGDLVSITDPRSKTWTYGYDANGMRTSATDPLGETSSWSFDAVGRIQWSVTPKGNEQGSSPNTYKTTYTTNAFGDVIATSDPLGHTTSKILDSNRNVVSSTDANAKTTTTAYDDVGRVLTVTRPDGTTLSNQYYDDGSLRAQIDGAGATTTYAYDLVGRTSSVTDPNGRTTSYGYNDLGNLVAKADPGGTCATNPATGCTLYGYDSAGQLKSITYSDGTTADVTDIGYDGDGRRISMTSDDGTAHWTWNSLGQLTHSDDPIGGGVDYGWDLAGNVTSITYPGGAHTVTRTYDDAGRFVESKDWADRTASFGYDANSNETTIDYPTAVHDKDTFVFDAADRLTNATNPAITYANDTSTLATLSYGRDNAGQLTSESQSGLAGPASQSYTYDANDRLVGVDAGTYSYDPADNLTKSTDGTRSVYDPANQLCFTAPSGVSGGTCSVAPVGATTYNYDARGNRTGSTPPVGASTTLGYDQANRLTSVVTPGPSDDTGHYHGVSPSRILDTRAGYRTGLCPTKKSQCVRIPAGATLTVQVTGKGSIPTTGVAAVALNVTTTGASSNGFVTVYSADLADNAATSNLNFTPSTGATNMVVTKVSASGRIKITSSGAATDVVIDTEGWYGAPSGQGGGELIAMDPVRAVDTRAAYRAGLCPKNLSQCVTLPAGGTITIQMTGQYNIPSSGVAAVVVNLTSTNTVANGFVTAYRSDISKPDTTNLTYTAGSTVAALSQVEVSNIGRIKVTSTAATDLVIDVVGWISSGSSEDGEAYTPIDPARILDTRTPVGECTPTCARLAASSTITVQVAGRLGVPQSGAAAVALNLTATAATGLGTIKAYASGHSVPSGTSLIYDTSDTANMALVALGEDGRIAITNEAATDLVIDVVGWYSAASGTWSYGYSPDGLRTTKAGPGSDVSYTWDRSGALPMLLATNTAGSGATYYIYGPGGLAYAQINPDGSVYYLHHDQLGSTRLITDSSGAVVGSASYDAYGNPSATTGDVTTDLGYAGQYVDAETGYQYLRARFYDPTTGQFLTRDPINALTRSPYGYVYGNPLNDTDPSGLWPDIDWGAVGQGVADFSGGVLNGITLGHADVFIDEDKVRWDSNWTRGGNVVGVALDIPLLIPQAAGAVGIEATAAGGGLLFGSKMASGFYGASLTAYGFYDLKQANDVCQRSPGSPACERAMKEAWVQTSVGGLAGFFPGAGGLAALLFGIYDCTNDYSDR